MLFRSNPLLTIGPHDFISDNGTEIYNLLRQKGIRTLFLMGVHTKGADVVRKDARWHLLYSDQTAALFGRNALPGVEPVVGNVAGSDGKPLDTYFP